MKREFNKISHAEKFLFSISAAFKRLGSRITTFRNDGINKGKTVMSGFTLIELLVVVLIIGILSAVALPQYQKAVEKSRVAEAKAVIKTIVQAREAYRLANGELPIDFSLLDISIPGEDDNGECVITKNWRYCIDVQSTDAGRNNVPDDKYYVISYYPNADNMNSGVLDGGYFVCNGWEDICKSLGGKKRGGHSNGNDYILP